MSQRNRVVDTLHKTSRKFLHWCIKPIPWRSQMSHQKCKIGKQWPLPLYRYDEIEARNKNKAEVSEAHKKFLLRRETSVITRRHNIIANNGQPLIVSQH